MSAEPETKKARLEANYELLYWPGIPGRGEYIRLPLEAAGIPYLDPGRDEEGGVKKIMAVIRDTSHDGPESPSLAPPILRVLSSGTEEGESILISQTANILLYIGDQNPSLCPTDSSKYLVHQYTLTALDLSTECHDTHHPIAVSDYYENQKEEALKRAKDFRANRIPKFFAHFNRVLKFNALKNPDSKGKYLVGDKLSYADTTLWQTVDGILFAFPKTVAALKEGGEYTELFNFYDSLKENLKEYLESSKRQKYSSGIFRYYPELEEDA